MLVEALGYEGGSRYVAFYWTPGGDELVWADGTTTATGGNWQAWLTFERHPLVQAGLAAAAQESGRAGFHFGDSDSEAEHALLVDRWQHTLDVGGLGEVESFLRSQPSEFQATVEHYDLTDEQVIEQLTAAYEEQFQRPPDDLLREAQERMRREQELHEQLRSWLDQTAEQLRRG